MILSGILQNMRDCTHGFAMGAEMNEAVPKPGKAAWTVGSSQCYMERVCAISNLHVFKLDQNKSCQLWTSAPSLCMWYLPWPWDLQLFPSAAGSGSVLEKHPFSQCLCL